MGTVKEVMIGNAIIRPIDRSHPGLTDKRAAELKRARRGAARMVLAALDYFMANDWHDILGDDGWEPNPTREMWRQFYKIKEQFRTEAEIED